MRNSNNLLLWMFLAFASVILVVFAFFANSEMLGRNAKTESNESTASAETPGQPKHGPVSTYKSGALHTTIHYDNGVKHGPSFLYYPNGQLMLEMTYERGKRVGESKKYYDDGQLYAVTPYEDNEITGMRRTYYTNGDLWAEIPYRRSLPGLGLVEYFQGGKKKAQPTFTWSPSATSDGTRLNLTIRDCNKAAFYMGDLQDDQYFSTDARYVTALPQSGGIHYVDLPRGWTGRLSIICSCTTKAGNPLITRRVYEAQ